jgi:hypothetical protein
MNSIILDNENNRQEFTGDIRMRHIRFEGYTAIDLITPDKAIVQFLNVRSLVVEVPDLPHLAGVYKVRDYSFVMGMYSISLVHYFEPNKSQNPFMTITGLDE